MKTNPLPHAPATVSYNQYKLSAELQQALDKIKVKPDYSPLIEILENGSLLIPELQKEYFSHCFLYMQDVRSLDDLLEDKHLTADHADKLVLGGIKYFETSLGTTASDSALLLKCAIKTRSNHKIGKAMHAINTLCKNLPIADLFKEAALYSVKAASLENINFLLRLFPEKYSIPLDTLADITDNNGNSLLNLAIDAGFIQITSLLIRNGADIDHPNCNEATPVMQLAARSSYFALKNFLETIGDRATTPRITGQEALHKTVNTKDTRGRTALHHAATNGRESMLQLLIDNGAKPTPDNDGNLPQHLSAQAGAEHTTAILFEQFPKTIDVVNRAGQTVEDLARYQIFDLKSKVESGVGDTLMHYAVRNHLDLNIQNIRDVEHVNAMFVACDQNGFSPLHLASIGPSLHCLDNLLSIAQTILTEQEFDTFINGESKNGRTPLHYLSLNGRGRMLERFMCHNPNLEKRDSEGNAAIHLAAEVGAVMTANIIIQEMGKRGVDFGLENNAGENFVHAALRHGDKQLLEELLKSDITNIREKILQLAEQQNSQTQESAIDCAVRNGSDFVIKFLLDLGVQLKPEHMATAILKGYHETSHLLLGLGLNKVPDNFIPPDLDANFLCSELCRDGLLFSEVARDNIMTQEEPNPLRMVMLKSYLSNNLEKICAVTDQLVTTTEGGYCKPLLSQVVKKLQSLLQERSTQINDFDPYSELLDKIGITNAIFDATPSLIDDDLKRRISEYDSQQLRSTDLERLSESPSDDRESRSDDVLGQIPALVQYLSGMVELVEQHASRCGSRVVAGEVPSTAVAPQAASGVQAANDTQISPN